MKVSITTSTWSSHANMLLSSALYWSKKYRNRIDIECVDNIDLPKNTFVIEVDGKLIFADYCDDYSLHPIGKTLDVYFKRSLSQDDFDKGICPLGFHFNYSNYLNRLALREGFFRKRNIVEIVRSLDILRLTNMSHFDMRVPHLFAPPKDNDGGVIFYTRLWDP